MAFSFPSLIPLFLLNYSHPSPVPHPSLFPTFFSRASWPEGYQWSNHRVCSARLCETPRRPGLPWWKRRPWYPWSVWSAWNSWTFWWATFWWPLEFTQIPKMAFSPQTFSAMHLSRFFWCKPPSVGDIICYGMAVKQCRDQTLVFHRQYK